MRVLSVSRPWPWAILHLGKPIENRKRRDGKMPPFCHYRGPLLLHAAKSWDARALSWMFDRGLIDTDTYSREIVESRHPGGVIFARCQVVGHLERQPTLPFDSSVPPYKFSSDSPSFTWGYDMRWWMGGYALVLADIQPMPLVACRGQLGLWTAPLDVMRQLDRLEKVNQP